MVVKPETLVGRHRKTMQLFWRWKSRGGRPRVPGSLRALIAEMVRENPTWGQRRVASELALKLGITFRRGPSAPIGPKNWNQTIDATPSAG